MQSNFIEVTTRHECSSINLPHIFRTPFPGNTSEGLLSKIFHTIAVLKILFEKINDLADFQGLNFFIKKGFCYDFFLWESLRKRSGQIIFENIF